MDFITQKAYRTASGYTIDALQKAIKEIDKSIEKGELVELFEARKKELQQALELILNDSSE